MFIFGMGLSSNLWIFLGLEKSTDIARTGRNGFCNLVSHLKCFPSITHIAGSFSANEIPPDPSSNQASLTLPTWPSASISSAPLWRRQAIMAAPGLALEASAVWAGPWLPNSGLQMGSFHPPMENVERTRTKQHLGTCPCVGPVC